jgi:hypothetical protein
MEKVLCGPYNLQRRDSLAKKTKIQNDHSRPVDWSLYFAEAPIASETFMTDVEDLPVQERE